MARRRRAVEAELADHTRVAQGVVEELMAAYSHGQGGRGTLDFLRLVNDPTQTAAQFRRMLSEARNEYIEFSRPPYAADPLDAEEVFRARERGVHCRVLVEHGTLDHEHERFLSDYASRGVEVRRLEKVPLKVAVLDGARGIMALLDPVLTKPAWTAVIFEHEGMAEAMKILFEDYWRRASSVSGKA